MSWVTWILYGVLLIGPLIFVHELGHLLAAKLVDVKVVRFSLGFGPSLARIRLGETEYRIAPIPLGGYVTLLGASPEEDVSASESDRALRNKPLWARYMVLGAGPLANLLLPILLYFAFFLGHTTVAPPIVGTVLDDSAAAASDLQPGDRIVSIDEHDVHSWQEMRERVQVAPEQELRVQIDREGVRFDRFVTPRKTMVKNAVGEQEAHGILGVTPWIYAPQVGIVDTSSPAYTEGLRTGDIITSINGEPIATVEQLERELERTRDTSLRLTYLRARSVRGEFGNYLWFESNHARLLRKQESGMMTGLLPANTFIRHVEPDSPASRAGLAAGDRILAIDDKPVTRWERLRDQLERKGEQPLKLTIQSPGGQPREIEVTQAVVHYRGIYKQPQSYLHFGAEPYRSFDVPEAEPIRGRFTYALGSAVDETWANIVTIWTTLRQMVTLQRGVDELSSVIGIFDVAGMAVEQGPGTVLRVMALLSINLGIVNLLPIPILDGGHLLFFTVEAARRRPLSQRAREVASAIGLVILLLLLLIALRNDIMRWIA